MERQFTGVRPQRKPGSLTSQPGVAHRVSMSADLDKMRQTSSASFLMRLSSR
ncbi:hypothetical protein [Bradyrhizobium sp. ARR65]|uniref:hypothetical protein n=1 Tax=Bradyrhizobium sp. ARR65 TaxID=1040989 RepID=UPI0018DD8CB3|nr:hypothetical protein [Bradyrhizobium sp. ARR65]